MGCLFCNGVYIAMHIMSLNVLGSIMTCSQCTDCTDFYNIFDYYVQVLCALICSPCSQLMDKVTYAKHSIGN